MAQLLRIIWGAAVHTAPEEGVAAGMWFQPLQGCIKSCGKMPVVLRRGLGVFGSPSQDEGQHPGSPQVTALDPLLYPQPIGAINHGVSSEAGIHWPSCKLQMFHSDLRRSRGNTLALLKSLLRFACFPSYGAGSIPLSG